MKKLIRFDWDIKTVLRKKDNFDILEAFISDLTGIDVKIQEILESESNQQEAHDKFNRVDILVRDKNDNRYIIEIQNNEEDYLESVLFSTSNKISLEEDYKNIKKVISINIDYSEFDEGEECIYHGKTEFVGMQTKTKLNENSQIMLATYEPYHEYDPKVFPEYYIIMPNRFTGETKDKFDEWLYLLKNSEIASTAKSTVMNRIDEQLNVLKMSKEERKTYERFVENQVIQETQMETAEAKGRKERTLELATAFLDVLDNETIAIKTGLSIEEVAGLRQQV